MVDQPRVELIHTIHGKVWRACGMGYCTYHQQRWQAEVLYECLVVAKGLRDQEPPHSGTGDA